AAVQDQRARRYLDNSIRGKMISGIAEIKIEVDRLSCGAVVDDALPEVERIAGKHKRTGVAAEVQRDELSVRGEIVVGCQPRAARKHKGIVTLRGFIETPIAGRVEIVVGASAIPDLWRDRRHVRPWRAGAGGHQSGHDRGRTQRVTI